MKFYAKKLLALTPSQNIIALDTLRKRYGEPERDNEGSYWDIDDEEVQQMLGSEGAL